MAIQEFLSAKQVFNSSDFRQAFPDSQTDRNLLTRAVATGKVDRVRRGLYVSRSGAFVHSQPSPFDVVAAAANDAIFCFLSALQLHGVLHNVVRKTQFFTDHKATAFEYANHAYQPIHHPTDSVQVQNLLTPVGKRYRVTTKEQTAIDCLSRPALAGGIENLLRSLGGFTRLGTNQLLPIVNSSPISVRARLGWVLETKAEEWQVDQQTLTEIAESLGSGPYYFGSATAQKTHWVNRWKLYLPYPEQEMTEWLNH